VFLEMSRCAGRRDLCDVSDSIISGGVWGTVFSFGMLSWRLFLELNSLDSLLV
jgi:hypothetical protein